MVPPSNAGFSDSKWLFFYTFIRRTAICLSFFFSYVTAVTVVLTFFFYVGFFFIRLFFCFFFSQLHLVTTNQGFTSTGGTSFLARSLKILRDNTDVFIVFQTSALAIRNFLGQLAVGDDYQLLKDVYLQIVESAQSESPTDSRISRPYLLLSLGNSTSRCFRVRYIYCCFFFHLSLSLLFSLLGITGYYYHDFFPY